MSLIIPDNRVSNIEFMCENLLEEKIERCFKIPINSESGEFVGAAPYKVDFGKYRISNMYYQIKVGEWVTTTCSTDSKGKRSCSTNRAPKYEDYVLETNYNKEFEVTETESPYIGGFLLLAETDGNQKPTLKVVEMYDNFDADIAHLDDEDLKLAITNHLTNLKE